MTISSISRIVGSAVVVVALGAGVMASTASAAPQATKKIVCYKGTTSKTFPAAKCPKGWSPKKPVTKAGTKTVSMNATYKGTIAMVWSASDVKATEVTGTGTDAASGLTSITATGGSAPQAQTAPIHGSGTLKGSTGSIDFVLNSDAKGTAADSAAPTMVIVTGTATIKSGTGKYAGATGVLTFKGQFNVSSTAAGAKESQSFTATFTGNIKLK
jgi:hypothetical protein